MTSSALGLHTYLERTKLLLRRNWGFFQIFSCQKCSSFLKQGIICQKNFVKVFNWRVGLHSFLANLMDNTNWVSVHYTQSLVRRKKTPQVFNDFCPVCRQLLHQTIYKTHCVNWPPTFHQIILSLKVIIAKIDEWLIVVSHSFCVVFD